MRAAGITALGEPVKILEVDELAPPSEDEVLIDVAAAGIGNWDELVRIGSWRIGGPAPMALGTEAAGTVAAAGSGVAEVGEGDEVITHPLPLRRHGTWTGRVLAPAATVAPRPPEASWEAGGAFPIPALTAAQALDEALGIESGGWVVVNGAGGVTGGLLVQLAAARGARVIATASPRKAERIRGYGASEVLDYHGDWPALVREITGGGAPKAVNAARGQADTTLKAVLTAAASPRSRATRRGRNGASPYPTSTSGPMVGSFRPSRSCWPTAGSACRSRPSVRSNRRHKRCAR